MTTHAMIDLETLGNKADAVVKQIGWAIFDTRADDGVLASGNIHLNIQDQLGRGRVVDGSTIGWWFKQGDAACRAMARDGKGLAEGLVDLDRAWMAHKPVRVWAKGPSFDVAILEHAYGMLGRSPPWKYSEVRDVRTVLEMFPPEGGEARPDLAHEAESDAIAQAISVQRSIRALLKREEYIDELEAKVSRLPGTPPPPAESDEASDASAR